MLATGPAALSRRAALVAAVAVVTVGCDLDPRADDPASPVPTCGQPPDADEARDLLLLEQVRGWLVTALTLVSSARVAHPTLRQTLGGLARIHRAHGRRLQPQPATDPGATPAVIDPDPARALATVRLEEERLQRRLATAAVAASSGGLARLLASMSAAVAQHVAQLPVDP